MTENEQDDERCEEIEAERRAALEVLVQVTERLKHTPEATNRIIVDRRTQETGPSIIEMAEAVLKKSNYPPPMHRDGSRCTDKKCERAHVPGKFVQKTLENLKRLNEETLKQSKGERSV